MEDLQRRGTVGVLDLASRRAEEAALRRYQAVHWLDYLVGPLGIPSQPSEKQFISCLRNGLVLCNLINKVQPGSVSKVIEKTAPLQSLPWDSQPLPAYQYFENIRNFLVAVEELRVPTFDASVFERENLVEGSSTKVVDCILALKDYHEWKQMTGGIGVYKPPRSPLILNSAGRICPITPGLVPSNSSRRLDMSRGSDKPMPSDSDFRKVEDTIVKVLAEHMIGSKENIDNNLVTSYRRGNVDPANFLSKILSSFEEQFRIKYPEAEVKFSLDHLRERSCSPLHAKSVPLVDLSNIENRKCCKACLKKGNCNHWNLVKQQEAELLNIKMLLSSAKQEAISLQSQIHNDLKQIGDQVLEMSSAALGYQKVVEENRKLCNMVQDLKARANKESSEALELKANKERCEVLELKAKIESLKKALGNKEITTPPPSKRITDSVRATSEKPKQMTERTPPLRVRRLSIENGSFMALEKSINYDDRKAAKTPPTKPKPTDRTPPPRARRLSIEIDTAVTASMNHEEKKGAKTPSTTTHSRRLSLEGPRNVQKDSNPMRSPVNDTTVAAGVSMNHEERNGAKTPSTTTRSRRLSLEGPRNVQKGSNPMRSPVNDTTVTAGVSMNNEERNRAKTPSTTTRSRRLSLEGPKNVQKDSIPMKSPEMMSKITKPGVRSLQTSQHDPRAPRSPLKSPMIKIDTAKMRLVPLQTPKTPEPQIKSRSEIQRPLLTDRSVSQTPCTTHGKGSQIRKSLRTIGKFINGSDKRNQQKPTEATTPFIGTGLLHDPKSPTSSNARALRRQSLTGIQPPERSRRSSIGGVPTDPFGNESRNAKTPPPQVRASVKLTKRWL